MTLGTSTRGRAARTPAPTAVPWRPEPCQVQLADDARDIIAALGLTGDRLKTPCA
ncbi:hypothetical protein ACH4MW_04210 [Streptomyces luteogriseus]|uniref:hypothetical protein n=1 Tax=Streptomyces luteogriseus TaxID=68233 RepID=UPI0037BD3AFF